MRFDVKSVRNARPRARGQKTTFASIDVAHRLADLCDRRPEGARRGEVFMKLAQIAVMACIAAPAFTAAQVPQPAVITGAPAPPLMATIMPSATGVLRAGTSVPLRTVTGLTTEGKHLKVGQRFELETTEAVTVNGQTVIPVGSRAMGEVTTVRNKGMWGKSGGITARLLYVRAGDRQLRLSGSMDDKGTTGTAGVVGAAVILPVVGFFVTGTSAKIPIGTQATGYLEEDVPVAFAAATAPAPLVVPAPAVSR